MTNEAALMGFIIFVIGIPLDMFIFRMIFCLLMTLILRYMATNKKLQGSIHLSGKTSQIVHKMLQDMMLGTVEKCRVKEFKKKIENPKATEKEKPSLVELFLKNKLADAKKEKFDEDEEDLRKNLHKYDIFEERDIILSSEGASTSRKVYNSEPMETDSKDLKEKVNEDKGSKEFSNDSNSLNEEDPEKSLSMKRLFGYYKEKGNKPEMYDDY